MLPHQQPKPLPDELDKHYGDMWYSVKRVWFENEFPIIAKFFHDKFHSGKYRNKNRWANRHVSFHITQNSLYGPGITRVYVVYAIRPYWFYSVEIARPKTTTFAAVLRGMLEDEWK